MRALSVVVAVLCAALMAPAPLRAEPPQGMVVLELFTTQGCAGSLAADAIAERLAGENAPDVLILACHVTFYNEGGWSDTLSHEACDARYTDYFNGLSLPSMSTPQVIVNGTFETSGRNESHLRAAVAMVRSIGGAPEVALRVEGKTLHARLPDISVERPVQVWLVAYRPVHEEKTTKADNRGRTIRYVNAVRRLDRLADWDGRALDIQAPLGGAPGDSYAVLVQAPETRAIVAAGRIEMKNNVPATQNW